MGEKARLRAEVIEAQQQRDAALARAERAERARDGAIAQMNAAIVGQRRQILPSLTGRFSDWLDDLHRAIGL